MYLKNEWIASAGYTFSRALMYSQLFGHTTIAFNRFTLFWMPYKYNSIWERPWYIIVMTFLPICCVLYGIDDPGRIEYQNGVLIAALKLPKNYNFANIMSYVVYIGNTAVSFILSMLALAKYRIMRTSGRLSGVKIKDRRLLMYTIVVLAFQCIKVCYLYLRPLFIGTPSIYKMLMNAVPVVYLLHALICSLSVIIICHSSRRAYTRFYVGLFLRLIYRRGSLKYPKKLIIPSTSYPTQQTVPAISCIKLPDGDKVRNA
uniref:Serpentine receptor class gamma n=1 Tax=Panagrellus redivivus TaxID=6233 RepID=A0A7E5A1A2_PANRE